MEKTNDKLNSDNHFTRQYWMDLARIFACFCVILVHVSNASTKSQGIIGVICHSAVPIFVMISGTNFLNPKREITITKMWKKYILPLFITFLCWSFLYAIYNSVLYCSDNYFEFIKNVIINTVNGHYHLWYIWMTIAMYAITVFIKKITDNCSNRELFYLLILSYVYLTMKYFVQFHPFDVFNSAVIDIRLTFVSGFFIYFVGGLFLSRIDYDKRISWFMLIFGLICFFANVIIVVFEIKCIEGGDVFGYFSPFIIGMSFSIYWFFSRFTPAFANKHNKIILKISKLTLPIYMAHVFAIELFKKALSVDSFNTYLVIPVSIAVFLICLFAAFLFDKNKTTRKLLNGN